jgi:hypothetical protein
VDNLASVAEVRFLLGVRTFSRRYLPLLFAAVGCFGVLGALLRFRFGPSLPVFVLFSMIAVVLYGLFLWRSRERLELVTLVDAVRIRAGRPTRLPADTIQGTRHQQGHGELRGDLEAVAKQTAGTGPGPDEGSTTLERGTRQILTFSREVGGTHAVNREQHGPGGSIGRGAVPSDDE